MTNQGTRWRVRLVVMAVVFAFSGAVWSQQASRKPAGETLRIVNDKLVRVNDGDCVGCRYGVKGSIYNPNDVAVKNVVISYRIWKKFMGKEDVKRGSIVKENGGLVVARIKYIPPKQTVEFLADEGVAPVYRDVEPDPVSVEKITGDWDD
jgi:hypothetical protein